MTDIERYGADGPGEEGFCDSGVVFAERAIVHVHRQSGETCFSFTPSISLFVNCKSEAEIDDLFAKLSEDGQI